MTTQMFVGDGHWDAVLAAQDQPFVYIQSNGSTWNGQDEAGLSALIELLGREPLDPRLESYGNFIEENPCHGVFNPEFRSRASAPRYIDGPPLFHVPVTHFDGNFATISHVFSIFTNDADTSARLTAAIRANQHTARYQQIKKGDLHAVQV